MIGDHLARIRGARSAVVAALDRLPSADEREALLRRDETLAAIERGLAVLLPEAWGLEDRPLRRPRLDEDRAVLADIRSTAAVLALRLEERPDRLTPGEEQDLAAAVALYRWAHTELGDRYGGIGTFPA
ncbi:MAG TPA: hypothetical protein VIG76_05750 [Amnibacterium sp.]|uniref:hypothetical protein n=1 Tax=Amnibacterium sp. TaxID=1872496 RepID=UPI002F91F532